MYEYAGMKNGILDNSSASFWENKNVNFEKTIFEKSIVLVVKQTLAKIRPQNKLDLILTQLFWQCVTLSRPVSNFYVTESIPLINWVYKK